MVDVDASRREMVVAREKERFGDRLKPLKVLIFGSMSTWGSVFVCGLSINRLSFPSNPTSKYVQRSLREVDRIISTTTKVRAELRLSDTQI